MKSKFKGASLLIICAAVIGFLSLNWTTKKSSAFDAQKFSGEQLFSGVVLAQGPVAQRIPQYADVQNILEKTKATVNKEAYEKQEQFLLGKINEAYPGYFDEFKREITSKDPLRVDAAMKKASEIMISTALFNRLPNGKNVTAMKNAVQTIAQTKPLEFNKFVSGIKSGEINKDNIYNKASELFGEEFAKENFISPNSKLTTLEEQCVVLNLGIVINVAIVINAAGYINVALAANVETGVNIHFAVNFWQEVDYAYDKTSKLQREKFISSIVENV